MSYNQMIPIVVSANIKDADFDSVIVVTDNVDSLTASQLDFIKQCISTYTSLDGSNDVSVIPCSDLPSGRLIYAPTGPVTRDYDDVRRFKEAAMAAIKKAVAAGSRSPLLVGPTHQRYPLAARVTFLGALQALYTPLEVRETLPTPFNKGDKLGLFLQGPGERKIVEALESGRFVCRDIHGSDPERMAPPKVALYVEEVFKGTCVSVTIEKDATVLEKDFPLFSAVNRAAKGVSRHEGCIIYLEYTGEGTIDQTLMMVGKGVTFDSGGADLKVNGAMVGMHRDKGGAAAVAGFFKILSMLKPKGLKVRGAMSVVRNSIGADCYVCDEIITSRAKKRIRIGNTDAEGRMAMADVLCQMKERAPGEIKPHLFTFATLTGHVIRAYGPDYTSVNSNGPAVSLGTPSLLNEAGAKSADPFEISTLRREDYVAHQGKSEYEEVLQANNQPSTATNRGHQNPMAFLIMASGLDAHGNDSQVPLPYSHLDIAGSSGNYPDMPTAAPIIALSHAYVVEREFSE